MGHTMYDDYSTFSGTAGLYTYYALIIRNKDEQTTKRVYCIGVLENVGRNVASVLKILNGKATWHNAGMPPPVPAKCRADA